MALLRQQNREAPFSEQSADDEFENLFDQYVTSDILDTENHLFESDVDGAECSALATGGGGIAAGPRRAVNAARRLESWQMVPWHEIAALSSGSQGGHFTFYRESSGRAAISDELLSLEGRISQIHPLIPSSSPPTLFPSHSAPSSTKRTEDLPVSSRNVCRDPTNRRKHRRKNSRASPTMNRLPTYQREPAQPWHQQLSSSSATPNLQVPPTSMPCTPPPSAGRQAFQGILTSKGEALNEGFDHNGHRISSQDRQFSVQPSPTVIVQHTQRPEMPHRSVSSNYPLGTTYPSSTQGFAPTIDSYHSSASFSASPVFETRQAQPWGYPAHTVSVSQPSQPAYQIPHLDPQHQAPKSPMQYTSRDYDSQMLDSGSASIANSGLMIHNANPPSPEDQLMTGMADDNSPAYFSDPMSILTPDVSSQGHTFESLPVKQPHLSVSPSSPPSRSRSRSPGPQIHCRRPSKTSSGSNRVRKHSGSGGYPSGQQPRTSTSEQPPNSSRRKHSSGSGYSSGQQPRSPSGEIVFQNLTANDSQVILSGVAPSGSSKTKERREKEAREKEKEAREKQKKMSEIAFAAVRAVGGDTEALVRQGLLSET